MNKSMQIEGKPLSTLTTKPKPIYEPKVASIASATKAPKPSGQI
jgi:hypothetical protein